MSTPAVGSGAGRRPTTAEILQFDPTNSVALLRRGDARTRLGEWTKALADYTESLRLNPQNPEALTSRGAAHYRLGQSDLAVADFSEALRVDPSYNPARVSRADLHLRQGEFDQAVADYNQAINLEPEAPRPYLGRGLGGWRRGIASGLLPTWPGDWGSPSGRHYLPRRRRRWRSCGRSMTR